MDYSHTVGCLGVKLVLAAEKRTAAMNDMVSVIVSLDSAKRHMKANTKALAFARKYNSFGFQEIASNLIDAETKFADAKLLVNSVRQTAIDANASVKTICCEMLVILNDKSITMEVCASNIKNIEARLSTIVHPSFNALVSSMVDAAKTNDIDTIVDKLVSMLNSSINESVEFVTALNVMCVMSDFHMTDGWLVL